jgi:hypothetical protein
MYSSLVPAICQGIEQLVALRWSPSNVDKMYLRKTIYHALRTAFHLCEHWQKEYFQSFYQCVFQAIARIPEDILLNWNCMISEGRANSS